jgi:hypothetical protein
VRKPIAATSSDCNARIEIPSRRIKGLYDSIPIEGDGDTMHIDLGAPAKGWIMAIDFNMGLYGIELITARTREIDIEVSVDELDEKGVVLRTVEATFTANMPKPFKAEIKSIMPMTRHVTLRPRCSKAPAEIRGVALSTVLDLSIVVTAVSAIAEETAQAA